MHADAVLACLIKKSILQNKVFIIVMIRKKFFAK